MSKSVGEISDWLDERQAQRLRQNYGQVGWLVSWQREEEGGPWLARLSCPGWAETIERYGVTRRTAINKADRALRALLREIEEASRQT